MNTKLAFGAILALPLVAAGCAREPEPEPTVVAVVPGPEQACAERAAQIPGLDPATLLATPVSSTKTGATVYAVDASGASYTCVVEFDGTVSSFAAGSGPNRSAGLAYEARRADLRQVRSRVMPLHRFSLRVYYEDTDLAGIVYHANYLKYFERARTEALIALGVDQAALKARAGVVFAVRRLAVEYRRPARFQEQLVVTTAAAAIGAARVDLEQAVWRDQTLLVETRATIVCLGPEGRAARLPAEVRAALAELGAP